MKSLERMVPSLLRPLVQLLMDPLQFSYQPKLGMREKSCHLPASLCLDRPGSTGESCSSTFPVHSTVSSLPCLGVSSRGSHLVSWTVDYLTHPPQVVRLQGCVSDIVVCNTGVPQDTDLSPFLFILCPSSFQFCLESWHLQNFSDDSTIVSFVTEG